MATSGKGVRRIFNTEAQRAQRTQRKAKEDTKGKRETRRRFEMKETDFCNCS
jgi:hypothetical protein